MWKLIFLFITSRLQVKLYFTRGDDSASISPVVLLSTPSVGNAEKSPRDLFGLRRGMSETDLSDPSVLESEDEDEEDDEWRAPVPPVQVTHI